MPRSELDKKYYDLKSLEELQALLDDMSDDERRALIFKPLGIDGEQTTLSYMVRDGYFCTEMGRDEPRAALTKIILDEIDKLAQPSDDLFDLLTARNQLGQSLFHKVIKYGKDEDVFDLLAARLYEWAPKHKADAFLEEILNEDLGVIDRDVSYALQDVRNVRPDEKISFDRINSICADHYKPATYAALNKLVDLVRPLIYEWLDKNPADPDDSYETDQHKKLREFADDKECVKRDGTLITRAFPGPAFFKLIELEQKFASLSDKSAQASRIFDHLSKGNSEGKTSMHRVWQHCLLLGPPREVGHMEDTLAPVIAGLDRLLGTKTAIDLTRLLLLLENDKGKLPLDNLMSYDETLKELSVESFLINLREELGSQEKFTEYVREIFAALLPADFTIKLSKYDIDASGAPKPMRGARLEP